MLTKKQILEIKSHLEKAQNPLFFFDNDSDGLCSFLILQRYIGRGKGIPIRSFPTLDADYSRKILELNADYVFILDKPVVSKEFLEEVFRLNIPIVWIDHHEIDKSQIPDFVNYYNPLFNKKKSNEPTTHLCYQATRKSDDLWIAVLGCIADGLVPEFYTKFKEKYPDLSFDSENAFDIFYNSQIGKILKLFNFGLKDRVTNVIYMLKFLMKAKNPYEILEEKKENYLMHKRYKEISQKYNKLIEKARELKDSGKLLFFSYGGDLSISSDLANELSYKNPDKYVIVGYVSGFKVNVSGRGKNVREFVLKAIEGLKDARGGGHENAVGAQVRVDDLDMFKERMGELINNNIKNT
jgi:single-stranded DNA-specific DHH superfamily exonuclease